MKKRQLKLGLNKVNVSKLSSVRGGNGSNVVGCLATISRNFIDVCCPIFGTEDCQNTELTTCHSGAPNCGGASDDCHYSYRSHCGITD